MSGLIVLAMLGIGDAEAHKNHNHANHHAHQHAHHHAHRAKIKKRQNHHKVTNYLVWIPGKWEIREYGYLEDGRQDTRVITDLIGHDNQ